MRYRSTQAEEGPVLCVTVACKWITNCSACGQSSAHSLGWREVLPARLQYSKSGAIGGGNGSVAWVDLGGWGVFKETGM